jgi:hypothetical protein
MEWYTKPVIAYLCYFTLQWPGISKKKVLPQSFHLQQHFALAVFFVVTEQHDQTASLFQTK